VFYCIFFFFFQAEDGIRDRTVTGVQTCALPISKLCLGTPVRETLFRGRPPHRKQEFPGRAFPNRVWERGGRGGRGGRGSRGERRSEERRVGKECRSGWGADDEKKKKLETKKGIR